MRHLDESPVPTRADLSTPTRDGRTLLRLRWWAVALALVAGGALAWSVKAIYDAGQRLSYYDACSDTAYWTPWLVSVVFGAFSLVLSIAWVVVAIKERRRDQIVVASLACVLCVVAGVLGAGFIFVSYFCM